MTDKQYIYSELCRQFDKHFDSGKELDKKAEVTIAVVFIVIGYMVQTSVKNPSTAQLVTTILGSTFLLISLGFSFAARKIEKVEVGSKGSYLLENYRFDKNKLFPNILKGLGSAIESQMKSNNKKADLINYSQIFFIIGALESLISLFIIRSFF